MSIFSFISDFFEFRRQRTFRYQFEKLLKQLAEEETPFHSIMLTCMGSEALKKPYSLNKFPLPDGKGTDVIIIIDRANRKIAEELFGTSISEISILNTCKDMDIPTFLHLWKGKPL